MIPHEPHTFSANSQAIHEKRYLDKDAGTIEKLHRRVSGGNEEYFRLMNNAWFMPNSPALFNMGTKQGGTSSACFVFDLDDSLLGDWPNGGLPEPFANSILGTTFKAAAVAKAGGGVGYYLGKLREEGAEVKSTHKKACGPVTVLRWLNGINRLITQGGKRALAQMGILDAHHPDIRKFIHVKDENPDELSSFNISVSWRNDWLKQVDFDMFPVFNGKAISTLGKNNQTALWWEQCHSAWKTGDPGMFFYDTMNLSNVTPHIGNINATNPCGETPNLSDEPCNLGSISLIKFVRKIGNKFVFLWDLFKEVVRASIRFMDDILDWNVFPHPDITKMALSTRKLGLGVMGYAATLHLLGYDYDTQDAVDWGEELMKVQNQTALDESDKLGHSKGVYPAFDKVRSPHWAPMVRNSTRTSIAPTGTIYLLSDAQTSGIEPYFALETQRTTGEGLKLRESVSAVAETGRTPKLANEIGIEWHVRHQAAFQKHTDLGVSKTINLPKSASIKDVSDCYRLMWQLGCKGGTIYRDGCRDDQVLRDVSKKTTNVYVSGNVESEVLKPYLEEIESLKKNVATLAAATKTSKSPQRRKMPNERNGSTHKFKIGGTEGYLTANTYEDGTLGEIFVVVDGQGSTLDGFLDAWCKAFSTALQYGTPLDKLIKLHKHSKFEPAGFTGNPKVPNCTSLVDYIVRWLEIRFLKQTKQPNISNDVKSAVLEILGNTISTAETEVMSMIRSGEFCPDCHEELIRQAGCLVCVTPKCGFSKC